MSRAIVPVDYWTTPRAGEAWRLDEIGRTRATIARDASVDLGYPAQKAQRVWRILMEPADGQCDAFLLTRFKVGNDDVLAIPDQPVVCGLFSPLAFDNTISLPSLARGARLTFVVQNLRDEQEVSVRFFGEVRA